MPDLCRLEELLVPYTYGMTTGAYQTLAEYVALVMRWNARTNLTAIRDEETLIQRQVGESLFAAQFLDSTSSLLDFGSGAGFPGIPLAIALPGLRVTLAESQGKKSSFLREAVRSLQLVNVDVFSGRVETLAHQNTFDAVVMRAVDQSAAMLPVAESRVAPRGRLLRYLSGAEPTEVAGWELLRVAPVPLSEGRLASWTR